MATEKIRLFGRPPRYQATPENGGLYGKSGDQQSLHAD